MNGKINLYRTHNHEMLGGVCSGIGEILGIDPTVIRLVFILSASLGLYLILWLILPLKD